MISDGATYFLKKYLTNTPSICVDRKSTRASTVVSSCPP